MERAEILGVFKKHIQAASEEIAKSDLDIDIWWPPDAGDRLAEFVTSILSWSEAAQQVMKANEEPSDD